MSSFLGTFILQLLIVHARIIFCDQSRLLNTFNIRPHSQNNNFDVPLKHFYLIPIDRFDIEISSVFILKKSLDSKEHFFVNELKKPVPIAQNQKIFNSTRSVKLRTLSNNSTSRSFDVSALISWGPQYVSNLNK